MSIKKNVASQKIGWLLVDSTDFATPETSPTSHVGIVRLDGGASATLSNTISELTNGQFVITLSQGETNADLLQFKFTADEAANQYLIFYPESVTSITSTILVDLTAVGLDVESILSTTASTLEDITDGTFGLDALETITSQTKSTIDDPVTDFLTSIVDDTSKIHSTLDNATFGLDALESLGSEVAADVAQRTSDISNIESILGNAGTADWGTKEKQQIRSALGISGATSALEAYGVNSRLDNATFGLDALESLGSQTIADVVQRTSDISNIESIVVAQGTSGSADWSAKEQAQIRSALGVSGAVSSLEAWGTNSRLDNGTIGLDALETITSQTKSTLDNATFGLDALETITSQTKSTIDDPITDFLTSIVDDTSKIHSTLDARSSDIISILVDTGTTLDDLANSILDDTQSLIVDVAQTTSIASNILSTLDDNVEDKLASILIDTTSILVDTTSILVDTTTTLDNKIDSILSTVASVLVDTGTDLASQCSSIESAVAGAMAEPSAGAPTVTPALKEAIAYLYTQWRNKTETTSGTQKLYADDGATVLLSTALSDDATTFTKDEFA